jgi:multidrug transporter EmrE-like cation transporter
VTPGGEQGAGHSLLVGFLVLQLGMAGWSFGSIYQRRNAGKAHPVVAGGIHQLAAGDGDGAVRVAGPAPSHPLEHARRGALLYLVVFGSLVGYSAFVYVMDRLPVAVVSIYPYVNAVVAVALGWLFYREPFGLRESAGDAGDLRGGGAGQALLPPRGGLGWPSLAASAPPAMLRQVVRMNNCSSSTRRCPTSFSASPAVPESAVRRGTAAAPTPR